MTLQNKNLYDPVEYMIRHMNKKKPGGGRPNEDLLDEITPINLIREKGILVKVVGDDFFVIDLLYNSKKVLYKVIGTCNNGYRLEITLIYTNGILTRVEPVEFGEGEDQDDTNNWEDPVRL